MVSVQKKKECYYIRDNKDYVQIGKNKPKFNHYSKN